MIKLINLLPVNIYHDPFSGELQEGLIRTVPVRDAMRIFNKNLKSYKYRELMDDINIISVGFAPTYPSDSTGKYTSSNLVDPKISELLSLANNLGYFPSMFSYILNPYNPEDEEEEKIEKYTPSKLRDLIINKQPFFIRFQFEPKYDPVIEVPRFVYHITVDRNIDKIKKIGLTPKTQGKRSIHPERIYVSLSKKDSDFLFSRLKYHFGKSQGVELVIDTAALKQTFYEDPNFERKGAYTYANIPPQAIIEYNVLDEN